MLSLVNITHQDGMLINKDESRWTHHNHPMPGVYSTVHSRGCTVNGFAQNHNDVIVIPPDNSEGIALFNPSQSPWNKEIFEILQAQYPHASKSLL